MRNGCGPDSKPVSRGFDSFHRCFSGIHEYRHEQLTTGHLSHSSPVTDSRGGTFPASPPVRRGRRPGASRAGVPEPATPRGRDQLWASGKATSFRDGMRTSRVRVPPAGPGARRKLATGRAGAGNVPCDGNPRHIRRRALHARGSTGESTGLRSRGVQVRVLPGVLCPRQKRAMRRDVDPEEAGSSPAGHPRARQPPRARRPHRTTIASSGRRTGQSDVPAALAQLGRGTWLRTRRFRVRIPGAARDHLTSSIT